MSVNRITIEHLELACRHFLELRQAGVTENLAIRHLEHFADVYAKLAHGHSATPNHATKVKLWSKAALKLKARNPDARAGDLYCVEHGTPRRAFARMVLDRYTARGLTSRSMSALAARYWRLAVITREEDSRLNRLARSLPHATPEARWAAAGIEF